MCCLKNHLIDDSLPNTYKENNFTENTSNKNMNYFCYLNILLYLLLYMMRESSI